MSDIIQEYSNAGFALFPISGKTPQIPQWQKTQPNSSLIRADMPGNYGVVLPDNIMVIDVDVKHGDGRPHYTKLYQYLELSKGWEMDTFTVRTGTGGFHVYLRKPEGVKIRKSHPDYPNIDFLSRGNFVVGAESIHPDTHQPYLVVYRSPKEILDAPAALIELLEKPKNIIEGGQDGFTDDSTQNQNRFINLLENLPMVERGGQRNAAYIAACRGRDLGLSQRVTTNILDRNYNGVKLTPAIRADEIEECTRNAYKYAQNKPGNQNVGAAFATVEVEKTPEFSDLRYDQDKNGQATKTLNNAVNFITILLPNIFRFNTFSNHVEVDTAAPWYGSRGSYSQTYIEADSKLLKYFLATKIRLEFTTEQIWEAVTVVAHRKHYHPIRQYLKNLVWDGVHRIDNWMPEYLHTEDNAYTRSVGRKLLCAAVKRVMKPGCKWDYVVILEGPQGIGKSTVANSLGRFWSGRMALDPRSRDSVSRMLGKWIIELDEMVALRFADASALKSFISCEVDTHRLAYDKHAQDYPRQSVFIGTVNPDQGYLSDPTGNRRFWIVTCPQKIDLLRFDEIVEQLWAEAFSVYDKEQLYLIGEAEEKQILAAKSRMPEEPMSIMVTEWLKANSEKDEVTAAEVLHWSGLVPTRITKSDLSRVTTVFMAAGWVRVPGVTGDVVLSRPLVDRLSRI
jgi:predicted P-loop ATPase